MGAVIYLLQVSGCTAIFYLFYYLLLSQLTFFTINRYYLLFTLVLCFVIPLLTIPVQQDFNVVQVIQPAGYIKILQKYTQSAHASQVTNAPVINWLLVLKWFYLLVATTLFIKLLISLFNFFIKLKQRKVKRFGHIHILRGNKKLRNGSFLNYIFLNDSDLSHGQVHQVIAHEMLHVKLLHSIDRVIMKTAQIVLWFNPFVYLYGRAMEANHEFEVDSELARSTDKKEYAALLLHLSVAARAGIYNSFSKEPLKKRITMLFSQPSTKIMKLVYLLALPELILSCMAFATFSNNSNGHSTKSKLNTPTNAAYANGFRSKMLVLKVRGEIEQTIGGGNFDGDKFYSRVALDDGIYDMICIKLNGAKHITFLPHNVLIAIIINGTIHQEDEAASFTKSQIDSYRNESVKAVAGGAARRYLNASLSRYGAYIEVGSDFNTATVNVKPNSAIDALPWQMRNIVIDADGAVEGN